MPAARTSGFKDEVAIADAGRLRRGTLRTTVFHFTTSLFPLIRYERTGRDVGFSGGAPNSVPYPVAGKRRRDGAKHRSAVAR
jgi:hypothetical protein